MMPSNVTERSSNDIATNELCIFMYNCLLYSKTYQLMAGKI